MKFIAVFVLLLSIFSFTSLPSFRDQQKKYERVRAAYAEKETMVKELLKKKNIDPSHFSVLINVYKKEAKLEIWCKSPATKMYQLIQTFDVCSSSGAAGPKRKEGDGQVPEGFYYVNRFNPVSSFYLSLGINYPNASDVVFSEKGNSGGDIFIHGNCVTIGCIPMTDDRIKEIYLLAVEARTNGQEEIPVNIFPCRMDEEGMRYLLTQSKNNSSLYSFWQNLREGYDQFQKQKLPLQIKVDKEGKYIF